MNQWSRWIAALRGKKPSALGTAQGETAEKREKYLQIWRGCEPWLSDCKGHTLHLARTVCRELTGTVCAELSVSATGSERAEYLSGELNRFLARIPEAVSGVLGVGCGMFRVYPAGGKKIGVDFVLPDRYEVLERGEDGAARRVLFFEEQVQGRERYLRCEEHFLKGEGRYEILNRVYLVSDGQTLRQVPLTSVRRWAEYPARSEMTGMSGGFFVEWRLGGNGGRAEGEPIYSGALGLMQDADRQYERLLWEFEGGELAVDAASDAFRTDSSGRAILPAGKDRLFRMNAFDSGSESGELMRTFSPALRDESLIRGLNRILMFFEDAVGVARGTVSDPSAAAKTATEIKSMRQRTYLTVNELQKELLQVLKQTCEAMDRLCSLYRFCPTGQVLLHIGFGDGVLDQNEEKREADRADVQAGLMSGEEYRAKWYKGGEEYDADISEGAWN